MMRAPAIILLSVMAVGCRSSQPTMNPFGAPATVPPPGTGQASGGVAPYYQGAPPPGTPLQSQPGAMTPPAGGYRGAATTGGAVMGQPAGTQAVAVGEGAIRTEGGVVYLDGQVQPAAATSAAAADGNMLALAAADSGAPSLGEPAVRIPTDRDDLVPRREVFSSYAQDMNRADGRTHTLAIARGETTSGSAASGVAASSFVPAVTAQNETPRADSANASRTASTASASEGFRPRAGGGDARDHGSGGTTQLISRYGYDTDYRWVAGKLERSRISGQWKLRYIPIDGDTDKHGGSVRIANPEALAHIKPGDFVRVEGAIVESGESTAFAPGFRVAAVQPVGQ